MTSDEYEMVNLYPIDTGLPMTVWASPRGRARHAARLKVNKRHGPRMTVSNTAVVGISPVPHLVADRLTPHDQIAVFQWVLLNSAALIDYWNGKTSTTEFVQCLEKVK